jgi:hypothetical protein
MTLLRTILTTTLVLALAACTRPASPEVQAARAVAADPSATTEQVALAMVQANQIGDNLERLSLRAAKATSTWPMIQAHLGTDPTPFVTAKIREQLPRHQPAWDANLAAAYASLLTTEQMRSLALEGKRSPYMDDMRAAAAHVGPLMRDSSSGIVEQITFTAVSAAFLEAPATPQ